MSHIQGEVSAVFDNRTYKGQPNKYPYWKIMIGDSEFNAYTNNDIGVKKGDNVSLHFGISKKSGKTYIESDYETKKLKLQILPQGQPVPQPVPQGIPEEIPIDDDLTNFEPDHFASNGVIDNSGTNFDPNYLEKELTNPQNLKEQQIFCTAIVKSSIEGKFLEPTKDNIDKMILMLKDIYKRNFIK